MVYCSTGSLERLFVHPNNNLEERHWVDIAMGEDTPTFAVSICCDDEWIWEFWYDKTNYDLVKHVIMDCIFEAEDMDELIELMDEAFDELFYEIAVDTAELQEGEIECDGNCASCEFCED
jgi:hypothetical protein